jgi:putative transposase
MARLPRHALGGVPYHVMNRAHAHVSLFETERDYRMFEKVLWEAKRKFAVEVLAFCVMPNHWHLLVIPEKDGELSSFMQWLANTHTLRYRKAKGTQGQGALYQGRFKSLAIEDESYLSTVWRYIERNALTAGLVRQADDWPWSSLWWRKCRKEDARSLLSRPLFPDLASWMEYVNMKVTASEQALEANFSWNH